VHRLLPPALAAVLLTGVLAVSTPAQAADTASRRGASITVIGGTSTSRFSDEPGSASQGWWSIAGRRVGATSITLSAEGGSSITAAGNKCAGTTFGQRLRYLRKSDIVIVEAGADNHLVCQHGRARTVGRDESRRRIKDFVEQLGRRVDKLGIRRDHVFFVSPRGPLSGERGATLRSYIKKYAGRSSAGFRYIETPRLHTDQTIDGAQPNARGQRVISRQVVRAIAGYARTARSKPASATAGPSVMVVGDSITSWFSNEPGSPSQGWWSMLGRQIGASSVRTSAEGGSGMNVQGNQCTGTAFGQRLQHLQRADILIVEVGRNDYKSCGSDRLLRYMSAESQRPGVETYVRALSARVAELGMRPSQVWFVTPWGTREEAAREAMQGIIRTAATAPDIGFSFIETPVLPASMTIDGIHPNRRGNTLLAGVVRAAVTR